MFFSLKRCWLPLLVGILLPALTGCIPASGSGSRTDPSASAPKILRDRVELAPSLDARVTNIRFFEGERSKSALIKERAYETRFARASTRTVYTEIHLDHPQPGTKVYFPITLYFRQNGKTLRIEEFESRIGPDWTSSDHLVGAGEFDPGKWRVGAYEVDVYINAEKTATGHFEIF